MHRTHRAAEAVGKPAVSIISFALLQSVLAAGTDYRKSGHNHFYNLEYDQAISDFNKVIEQNSADPTSHNDLASAELYKELYRLGLLDTRALGRDNRFLQQHPAQPDPGAKTRFLNALDRGRQAAEGILTLNGHNDVALYALCTNYALRGTSDFMLDKSWFSALRNGSKARGYCEEAAKINPRLIDAYLVLGVFEYAAGSLPLPFKFLAVIGGLHGSRTKGIEYVTLVAQHGNYDRDAARVLLSVLWRREKRPQQAAQVLEALMTDFPRNYLFGLELACVYRDADRPHDALSVLKTLLQKEEEGNALRPRLPRDTVQLQIDALEAKLSTWRQPARPESRSGN